jgi:predicted NodU family carbamoyl transferase
LQPGEGAIILPFMLTLGLSNMRDAAAAIVANGRIIAAAEEERFVRIKHVTVLLVQAIRYCLRVAGVRLRDGGLELNTRIFDFHMAQRRFFSPEFFRLLDPNQEPEEEITQRHRDVVDSAQMVLEGTLLHIVRRLHRLTSLDRFFLAVGVAHNCVANSSCPWRGTGFREVYTLSAARDSGVPCGVTREM